VQEFAAQSDNAFMTVRAIALVPDPLCLNRDTSLFDALQLMLERGVNHLPVCDDGVWKGLVDIDDVLDALLPVGASGEHALPDLRFVGDATSLIAHQVEALASVTVGHIARHDVPALDEDTPLLEAALLLRRHGKPLPVVGTDGRLKGMLSRRALLAHVVKPAGR
jgi:CBS domain-containing protein